MREYYRPTVEDLDEYEEEEGEDEEDEYEEEEPRKPTKEELEYLELRKRLKDGFRKKIKKEGSSSHSSFEDRRNKLPYDNFGSFFGPSQPVISQRVIQESKSLLETQHLASKTQNTNHRSKNTFPSAATAPNSGVHHHQPKGNESRMKVQKIKDTRDYSFLLSDDAELPGPTKESQPQNISVSNSNSEVHSSRASLKGKQSLSSSGRQFLGTRDERKAISTNFPRQSKPGINNVTAANKSNSTSAKKPNSVPVDSRKIVQNNGNGPGWPVGPKAAPSKLTAAKVEKKPAVVGSKNSTPNLHKPISSQMRTSMPKQDSHQREVPKQHSHQREVPKQQYHQREMPKQQYHQRESQVPKKSYQQKQSQVPKMGTGASKQPMASAKPSMRKPSESFSSRKKKHVRSYLDDDGDDEAFEMLRQMTGYNPNKFVGHDEDDSDMEANFETIQREEKRSALIARQEDEEELQKIEEEERRERMRKLERKRKMSLR